MTTVWKLHNTVMPYAWGSHSMLAQLRGEQTPTLQPEAELWMGAHPKAPSRLALGRRETPLPEAIAADPTAMLGAGAALPFLFKVLAVERPLSIQAHPNAQQAAAGYAREMEQGVPTELRSYLAPNPKRELVCALEPFQAMAGFRPLREFAALLEQFGLLHFYDDLTGSELVDKASFRRFFQALMQTSPADLGQMIAQATGQGHTGPVFDLMTRLQALYPNDPGVLAPLFLNTFTLQPGEALYLEEGMPHAYLDGLAVEVMTNSDNVLRCGLTPKHRDVPELLRVLDWLFERPRVLRPVPVDDAEQTWKLVEPAFKLSRLHLQGIPLDRQVTSAEILLVTEGQCVLTAGEDMVLLKRGESAFVAAGAGELVLEGTGTVYRVRVS